MSELVSLTAALKRAGVPLQAQAVLQMMVWAGLVEEVEYRSSTGSGEIKTFSRLTTKGLAFGENIGTFSPTKTEIKIDPMMLKHILIECQQAFTSFVNELELKDSAAE